MPETLTDHWIDSLELDSLIYWADKLSVTHDDIDSLGLREAVKLRVWSDDHGVMPEFEVIETIPF